jgi:hypothetical protein
MPFNFLLLPLLGGFLFISQWYRTRFYALRVDGYRLLFYSAIAGSVLLFISSALIHISRFSDFYGPINEFWWSIAPFNYSGRTSLSLLLGILGALFLNQFIEEDDEIDRVVYEKQNPLEILLREAMGSEDLIALSVSNGKVYVGLITSNFNPAFIMEAIKLYPSLSGYRKDDTKEVVFTIDYSETYSKIREQVEGRINERLGQKPTSMTADQWEEQVENEIEDEMELHRFQLVIPVTEIQSAFIFDPEIYAEHFQSTQQEPSLPVPQEPPRNTTFSLFTFVKRD